jgi:hypothetical protein
MRILPGVLKELSKHVPTVLFQTVEWTELASEIPIISRRIIQKEGFSELYLAQEKLLALYKIRLSDQPVAQTTIPRGNWVGEKILTLYFAQLFSTHGIFIDLRMPHFEIERDHLVWHPTSFWTRLGDSFRLGLINVYDGFYLENDDLYYQGLEEIGLLMPNFSHEDKKELGDLFRNHFGGVRHEEMEFKLDKFRNSIISMSNFMLNKKVQISKDFLYLGIYLVTMYDILEEIGGTYPVKEIYLNVKKSLATQNGI